MIGAATFRPHIELLDLSSNRLGDDGVRRLVGNGSWPKLRSLHLGFNEITVDGLRELLPVAPQLSELSLSSSEITDAGALALADAVDSAKLSTMCLSYCPLSPDTVEKLRARFGPRFQFHTREDDARAGY